MTSQLPGHERHEGRMDSITHMLVMCLDGQRFALPVANIDRVLRAVEVTPLPKSPSSVLGVVNVQGRVVAAINLRRRCRLPEREIDPSDQFVIVRTARGVAALVVDHAEVMAFAASAIIRATEVVPNTDFVLGVVKREDGLILVCQAEALLTFSDEVISEALSRSMEGTIDSGAISTGAKASEAGAPP